MTDEELGVAASGEGAPEYVKEAMRGLTPTQRKMVIDGSCHGDVTMATIRALRGRALFYLKITSPNGRGGHMELTPLGVTVQGILKAKAALAAKLKNGAAR